MSFCLITFLFLHKPHLPREAALPFLQCWLVCSWRAQSSGIFFSSLNLRQLIYYINYFFICSVYIYYIITYCDNKTPLTWTGIKSANCIHYSFNKCPSCIRELKQNRKWMIICSKCIYFIGTHSGTLQLNIQIEHQVVRGNGCR